MKKFLLQFAFALLSICTFAQVGINTKSPQSSLDIRGKNDTGSSGVSIPGIVDAADGVLVPRVSALSTNGTVNGQLVYLVADNGAFTKGFYYWNGSAWTPFSGGGTTSIPDQTVDVAGLAAGLTSPNSFTGATFSPNTPADSNYIYINTADGTMWTYNGGQYTTYIAPKATEWYLANGTNDAASNKTSTIYRTGGVGIGSNINPDASAILDVNSTNKGVLLPRVNLTSTTMDLDGIAGQTTGLLVFNTGTTFAKGYYFWNGSEWRTIDNSTAVPPSIASVNCATAVLNPSTYTNGTNYTGVLSIPYENGNGGSYTGGTSITSNNLVFTLQAGKLNNGIGDLLFNVTGNPTLSSPNKTNILIDNTLIPFLSGASCTASVGESSAEIKTAAVMGPLTYTTNPSAGYEKPVTSPDGKFSCRVVIQSGSNFALSDLQIRSNTGAVTIIQNIASEYTGNGQIVAGNNAFSIPSGNVWYGDAGSTISSAWGDADVYYIAPEYRRYTWTTNDTTDKTMYTLTFMLGAPNPEVPANATNCPGGTCTSTKAFLKIEQIKAN